MRLGGVAAAFAFAATGLASWASSVWADRPATPEEQAAIAAGVLADCAPRGCNQVTAARVSTANRRWAIAGALGLDHDYIAVLSRPGGGDAWRVRTTIGGGAASCRQLIDAVPERVLRDFALGGVDADGGFIDPCVPARDRAIDPALRAGRLCDVNIPIGDPSTVLDEPGLLTAPFLRVRGARCAKARSAMLRASFTRTGAVNVRGWSCRTYRRRQEGRVMRCKQRAALIQFSARVP